ncbi:hypothetical protein TWF191_001764 [Orbilia oligospora]|uniref:THO complex subunit 1 transcription elongation factor-domain-containing protein n=2 Tax=Orbilia oligospora TaxID=2813651 RepID=A0A7C8QDS6_ORBOL|nr:hypothetical protein TWF191_001764 [Orbilia oligospora]
MVQQTPAAIARLKDSLRTTLPDFQSLSTSSDVPPFPTTIDRDRYFDTFKCFPENNDVKSCMECASRELLYDIVTDFDLEFSLEPFIQLYQFFDLILTLSELEISDPQLPFALIEETLDTQPIDNCKRIFSYLEARIERLTVGVDGTKGKGIILLRLCNELLRRLSKSEDTVFCGRIFVFLTKSFPLSERSGVNLRGEFHVENKTTFDERWSQLAGNQPDHFSPSLRDNDSSQAALAADACNRLYAVLWSTQHEFAEPIRLFQKEILDNFKESLDTVIKAFRSSIDEYGHNAPVVASDTRRSHKRKWDGEVKHDELDSYNPKYLTSRELFDLEVRDLVFRRHILVQFLIVIEFLLSLSPKYKKYLEAEAKNRSVQFAYTLSEEDDKWAEAAKKDVVNALNYKSGMDGLLFSRTVDSVLTREKNWVKWKAENCVSFEMEPASTEHVAVSKSVGHEATTLINNLGKVVGAPALTRVWFDNSLEVTSIRSNAQKINLPAYRSYAESIEGYHLDKDFASTEQEKEDIDESISNVTWRSLRVASRDRFQLFKSLDDDLSVKSLIAVEDGATTGGREAEKDNKKDIHATMDSDGVKSAS